MSMDVLEMRHLQMTPLSGNPGACIDTSCYEPPLPIFKKRERVCRRGVFSAQATEAWTLGGFFLSHASHGVLLTGYGHD